MIAVDTNILVYAHRGETPQHSRARAAIQSLVDSDEDWAIPWPSVHEFVSITTNPRIFSPPSTPREAFAQLQALTEAGAVFLAESESHFGTLRNLVIGANATGGAVHDARIAAICLDHGVKELWTADRDFTRFPSLRTSNPVSA